MEYQLTFERLIARIDALGDSPTESQATALVSWIVENLPVTMWEEAAIEAIHIDGVYSELSMRQGEMGW